MRRSFQQLWATQSHRSNRRECSEAQLGDSVGDTSVSSVYLAAAALQQARKCRPLAQLIQMPRGYINPLIL